MHMQVMMLTMMIPCRNCMVLSMGVSASKPVQVDANLSCKMASSCSAKSSASCCSLAFSCSVARASCSSSWLCLCQHGTCSTKWGASKLALQHALQHPPVHPVRIFEQQRSFGMCALSPVNSANLNYANVPLLQVCYMPTTATHIMQSFHYTCPANKGRIRKVLSVCLCEALFWRIMHVNYCNAYSYCRYMEV